VGREWELDDLIASWTLVDADQELLVGKHDVPRLSCAVMVKFFEIEGRFLRHVGEVPPAAGARRRSFGSPGVAARNCRWPR
jgi:hypothetical protein